MQLLYEEKKASYKRACRAAENGNPKAKLYTETLEAQLDVLAFILGVDE